VRYTFQKLPAAELEQVSSAIAVAEALKSKVQHNAQLYNYLTVDIFTTRCSAFVWREKIQGLRGPPPASVELFANFEQHGRSKNN
jgi:hypothetical protein